LAKDEAVLPYKDESQNHRMNIEGVTAVSASPWQQKRGKEQSTASLAKSVSVRERSTLSPLQNARQSATSCTPKRRRMECISVSNDDNVFCNEYVLQKAHSTNKRCFWKSSSTSFEPLWTWSNLCSFLLIKLSF
jgi:hypothetical protein